MLNTRGCYLKLMDIENIPYVTNLLSQKSASMLSDIFGSNSDKEKIENILHALIKENLNDRMYFLCFSKKGKHIGWVSLANIDFIKGSAEFGILIDENNLGIGYGPIIGALVQKFCFEELNLIKIYYKNRDDNFRFINRTKKGILRNVPYNKDIDHNYYYGEILKNSY